MQSVYRVSQGAGLALTTARYFTPSGRLIQRPWDGTFDEYLTYTLQGSGRASAHAGAAEVHRPAAARSTAAAASSPIAASTARSKASTRRTFGRSLFTRQLFASYAEQFTAEGDTRAGAQGKNRKVVRKDFVVDDAMVQDFKQFVDRTRKVTIDEAALTKDKDVHPRDDSLRHRRRAVHASPSARQRLMADDPQAQFALTLFPEAEKLLGAAEEPRPTEGQGQIRREQIRLCGDSESR